MVAWPGVLPQCLMTVSVDPQTPSSVAVSQNLYNTTPTNLHCELKKHTKMFFDIQSTKPDQL